MTDARIESIKKALGLTKETREQNARQNLDGALIEIERNEGRIDADCLRKISRVVGHSPPLNGFCEKKTNDERPPSSRVTVILRC